MKFYTPIAKKYFYLSSEDTICEKVNDGTYNLYFKWYIPAENINVSELRIVSITSTIALNSAARFVIYIDDVAPINIYNNMNGNPILHVLTGLNQSDITNAPCLRLKNTTLNYIKIQIKPKITLDGLSEGLAMAENFVICLELTDYKEEERSYSYNVNEKQRIARPDYLY